MLTDQITIEEDMLTEAQHRQDQDNLKTSNRGAWSESRAGKSFQTSFSKVFTTVVAERMGDYIPGKAGSNRQAIKLLAQSGIQPDVIAHLFVKALLNSLQIRGGRSARPKPIRRLSVIKRAAQLIHDELRIRHFAEAKERKNLLKKLFKQFDKRSYPRDWRKRTILNYFHAEQIEWEGWTEQEMIHIGAALLQWFMDSTGMVELKVKDQYVMPSVEFIQHVEALLKARVMDFTLYKPMVVKPLPWTEANLFRGGYISDKIKHYQLIKRTGRKDVAEMRDRDWSQILPAINALQETPWRINKEVLKALMWAMHERGGGIAGLPLFDMKPLPPTPEGYTTDEEIKKVHNVICFRIHSENREMKSKRMAILQTISLARQYKQFDAIYFPHNLDSRGRAYPLPAFLNPQGRDSTKALLEFAKGEVIENEEQACWLAIAGANAFGNDKVSLQERADWVADNEEMILSIASDPTMDIRWTEASEPFMFLRFCFEWRDFLRDGFGFVSHMVCHVDATCSGLQNYSAMLRDEVGGRSVNLIPGLRRQDIYQDVANVVIEKLMATTGEERVTAGNLIGIGIDRKVTKRQVMVVPYAGTFSSCMEYTRAAIQEKLKGGAVAGWNVEDSEEDRKHVVMLAQFIWQAIEEVVIKANEAMSWLTKSARAYIKRSNTRIDITTREKAITWVTPDGLLVRHLRLDLQRKRIDTYLDGKVRVQLVYYTEADRLDSDMATALPPNFIHSMDACLLRMAVMKGLGLARPITSYGMIHDSFGVHASRMQEFLSACARPAFVQMYQRDVLADFRDRLVSADEGLKLEPIPAKGTLDLAGVMDSEFFFS